MRALNWIVAVLLLLIGWLAGALGAYLQLIGYFLVTAFAYRLVAVIVRATRGTLELGLLRHPRAPELRWHRWQALNRGLFWLSALPVFQLCVVPAQIDADVQTAARVLIFGLMAGLLVLELFPSRRVFLPLNVTLAAGWVFVAVEAAAVLLPRAPEDAVTLRPPFRGEWVAVQAGNGRLVNHHFVARSQAHAVDFCRVVADRDRTGDGKASETLESFYSWGQPLFAPASGKVVEVVNNLPDNRIGKSDRAHVSGNHIVIEIGPGRYVLLAHLRCGTVTAKVGDRVTAGEPIAECGNSGNTSMPHLHLQVQDHVDTFADGARTYPMIFASATVMRSGHAVAGAPPVPTRNDLIRADETPAGAGQH